MLNKGSLGRNQKYEHRLEPKRELFDARLDLEWPRLMVSRASWIG